MMALRLARRRIAGPPLSSRRPSLVVNPVRGTPQSPGRSGGSRTWTLRRAATWPRRRFAQSCRRPGCTPSSRSGGRLGGPTPRSATASATRTSTRRRSGRRPYSILKVRFEPRVKDDFMFHDGEEFLAPIDGEVTYHFFWSGGLTPAARSCSWTLRSGPVRLSRSTRRRRITRGRAGERPAEAWMIMRDASNRAVSISTDPDVTARANRYGVSRRASVEQLQDPSRYALIAWGLLERIRSHRERARLTIAELALRRPRCGPPVPRRGRQSQSVSRGTGTNWALPSDQRRRSRARSSRPALAD